MWAFYGNLWGKGDHLMETSYLKAHPFENRYPEWMPNLHSNRSQDSNQCALSCSSTWFRFPPRNVNNTFIVQLYYMFLFFWFNFLLFFHFCWFTFVKFCKLPSYSPHKPKSWDVCKSPWLSGYFEQKNPHTVKDIFKSVCYFAEKNTQKWHFARFSGYLKKIKRKLKQSWSIN